MFFCSNSVFQSLQNGEAQPLHSQEFSLQNGSVFFIQKKILTKFSQSLLRRGGCASPFCRDLRCPTIKGKKTCCRLRGWVPFKMGAHDPTGVIGRGIQFLCKLAGLLRELDTKFRGLYEKDQPAGVFFQEFPGIFVFENTKNPRNF